MENMNEGPVNKHEADKDDATKAFENSETEFAADVNRGGDKKTRNYKEGDDEKNGPNWDRDSTSAEGDTTVNAGTFK